MTKKYILTELQKKSFEQFKNHVLCCEYSLLTEHLEENLTEQDRNALDFAIKEVKHKAVHLFECAYYNRSPVNYFDGEISMADCPDEFNRFVDCNLGLKPLYVDGELNCYTIDYNRLVEHYVGCMADEFFTNEENWRVL